MTNVQHKIKRLREAKGFSQEYMSLQLQMSQRAYSRMETGETKLSWDRIRDIAAILEADPVELVTGDDIAFNNCDISSNNGLIHTTNNYHNEEINQVLQQEVIFCVSN